MTTGKKLLVSLGTLAVLLVSGCSSSSKSNPGSLDAVSQDLTVDPTGQTTVLTFSRDVSDTLTPGNFVADGGQLATGVTVNGSTVTVTWDARVTPSHQVRSSGISGIPNDFVTVTTTDASAPTFTISGGTQTVGLGGDTFTITFAGPNVAEETAEDLANWDLSIGGESLDLTGSTFVFDEGTQTVAVTLGTLANLHATFDLEPSGVTSVADVDLAGPVAGAAAGDAIAPSLVSIEQNLTESEYGFVVDFTFDEAMDPALIPLAAFDAGLPTIFATSYESISDTELRVTFNTPVIPGQDTIDLVNVMDAHGNTLSSAGQAVAAPTTVANAYATDTPEVATVENVGGDTIVVGFDQAIDPDTADLAATWDFESPTGNDIDLSTATLDYDFLGKTLTITLAIDDLVTGDTWTLTPVGAGPLDVDGENFTASTSGTVGGDATEPTVVQFTQNRVLDPTGMTFELELSEDVDDVQAETTTNYVFSNGANVLTADLLANGNTVRVTVDAQTLPGEDTVSVANLVDIAGNTFTTVPMQALVSTDSSSPTTAFETVFAEAGLDNDTITVVFDDDMVVAEVTDPLNWVFESPAGSAVDTTNASVNWNPTTHQAVLTFDGGDGINLKVQDDFSLRFVTMRDFGGNTVVGTAVTGDVDAESEFPTIVSAWVESANSNKVHVRFDEPVEGWTDSFAAFGIRDGGGLDVGGGPPIIVEDADSMGATLTWAVGVMAGTHTIDVRGITDLAGNQMFPADLVPIVAEISAEPGLDVGISEYTAVSGEENDTISIVFDQPVSPWELLDPANFTLTDGGTPADFSTASFSFDGTDTVEVTFDGSGGFDFDNGAYTLTVDNVLSAQGVEMSASSMDTTNASLATDVASATAVSGRTRLDAADAANSVLIEMSEAQDAGEAVTVTNYEIGGVNPDSVSQVGPRTVRATWSGGVTAGQTVDITGTDLAGNAGLVSEAIQVVDTSGPAVTGVAGIVDPGTGGDVVVVTFTEPVLMGDATTASNYTVSSGGNAIDVSSALVTYSSVTNSVTIPLPTDLTETDTVNVMVSGVRNHAGITMDPPANVNGSISGDGVAPTFEVAYANYREDLSGQTIDVMFSEDVDETFATDTLNYVFSGGQSALDAQMVRPDTVRLTLNAALFPTETVEVTGLPDLAGNASGLITTSPVL